MDVSVHGFAACFSVRDRIDRKLCTVSDIAADEDIGIICLECDGIINDCSVGSCLYLCVFQQIAPYRRLADCLQDIFCIDGDESFFVILG